MAPSGSHPAECSREDARRLFKAVTGVLNGAFAEDQLSRVHTEIQKFHSKHTVTSSMDEACVALAMAVEQDLVPANGLQVLKVLLQSSDSCNNCPKLLTALGINVPEQEAVDVPEKHPEDLGDTDLDSSATSDVISEAAVQPVQWDQVAQPLFKLVSGTLNGALNPAQQADMAEQLRQKLSITKVLSFQEHCDLLADAIEQEAVPSRGCQVLCGLASSMSAHGLSHHSKLVAALDVDLTTLEAVDVIIALLKDPSEVSPKDTDSVQKNADMVATAIKARSIPRSTVDTLVRLAEHLPALHLESSVLHEALWEFLCPQCKVNRPAEISCSKCRHGRSPCGACNGTGKYSPDCRSCGGSGKGITKKYCPSCNGYGRKVLGECRACSGSGGTDCTACCQKPEHGAPRPYCVSCRFARASAARAPRSGPPKKAPPAEGFSITACGKGELALLQELWSARGASGGVSAAWKIDHPIRSDRFLQRREQLARQLGREADSLKGFHGTHPDNILSICENGFDRSKRGSAVGQIYGSGEYLAKNPNVSVGYCRGGEYMLVCRLSLGVTSSNEQNTDGDHIWVPHCQYYVISSPDQIMPEYIVRFSGSHSHYGHAPTNSALEQALSAGKYSTMKQQAVIPVPPPRPCLMSRAHARVLWMGMLHAHIGDDALRQNVTTFLKKFATKYTKDMRVQIVKGYFKKAHVVLAPGVEMPQAVVKSLNTADFVEDGKSRRICVEDAHGSPGQDCPKWIAGYCRGQNLRFTHPCWCSHKTRPTDRATFTLTPVDLDGAKGNEILTNFMASSPFHSGAPRVKAINAISNPTLARLHAEYRDYLRTKHMEEPPLQELYHGTNNNIVDILYKHGLQPPSDMEPSEQCPISGGKGLCTSLCNNDCKFCVRKHEWKRCHMFGLGIYLADMAQKSHRYCSQPKMKNGKQEYRMVLCQVLGKSYKLEGHLREGTAMHDVVNVRSCTDEDLDNWLETCHSCAVSSGVGASIQGANGENWGCVVADEGHCWRLSNGRIAKKENEGHRWYWAQAVETAADNLEVAEKSDLLYVKGLGMNHRPGFSVVNSEYIAFHPHQCLPKYEIIYEMDSAYF